MLFKPFSKNKKLAVLTLLTVSALSTSACSFELSFSTDDKDEKHIAEVMNTPAEKVVEVEIEDSKREERDLERITYGFYQALSSKKPKELEGEEFKKCSEVEDKNIYHSVTTLAEEKFAISLKPSEGKSLEENIASLDDEKIVELIDFSDNFFPENVDFNYDSLTPVQKAYTGIMLGNMLLCGERDSDIFAEDYKIISGIDKDKVFLRDTDIIVPRNAISFNNSNLGDKELFSIPLRIVKTQERGYVVDFYTYAKMLEKFPNSLTEIRELYQEQSPRLVDEVIKENAL